MIINVWGRQTGKTTKALEMFIDTPNCLFFTIDNRSKRIIQDKLKFMEHEELCQFVKSYRGSWRGSSKEKAILDEPSSVEDKYLRKIEKYLSIVAIFTSPGWESRWLREKIYNYKNSYIRIPATESKLLSNEILMRQKHMLGRKNYEREYLAKPEEMDVLDWEQFWDMLITSLPDIIDKEYFLSHLKVFQRSHANWRTDDV